jgi:WD40 repeat protein
LVFDLDSGKNTFFKEGGETISKEAQLSAALSPNGQFLALSENNTTTIVNVETRDAATNPIQHDDVVALSAFDPFGARLATATVDGIVTVWETKTGKPLSLPLRHGRPVSSLAFNQDATRIAVATQDHKIHLWDIESGETLTPPLHSRSRSTIGSARFGADQESVFVSTLPLQITERETETRISVYPIRKWGDEETMPGWFLETAEAIAGQRINGDGVLISLPFQEIVRIREMALEMSGGGEAAALARKLLVN